MLGRGRREERRDDRQDDRGGPLGRDSGGGANRYQMTQKMLSIGNDFWIENERGEKVFKVDGKALRVRNTLVFEDASGRELCKIQERMLRVKESMEIEDANGRQIAMVKKAMITPLRERWTVNLRGGPDLDIQGNLLDHEYRIEQGRDRVAEISKKWFRLRDSYGVEIDPGQDDILILAVTVAVDMMAHPTR
ncbi:MAG: LURP-one-related family protein [Caldilinea sp.]